MKKCYDINQMEEFIPDLKKFEHQKVSASLVTGVLEYVDEWASHNGLKLFQILAIPHATMIFVFEEI